MLRNKVLIFLLTLVVSEVSLAQRSRPCDATAPCPLGWVCDYSESSYEDPKPHIGMCVPPKSTLTTSRWPAPTYQPCGGFVPAPDPNPCPKGYVCMDDPRKGGCGMACDMPGICVEPNFCGGFAGIQCPRGMGCYDDPKDNCDPKHGGADCGGLCI
jgi:hypothetical protein